MSEIYNQVLLHWIDQNGGTAVSFMTTQDQDAGGASAYSSLAAAAQACCDAAVVAVQFQTTLVLTATPTSGPYKTVWDRGVLIGRNSVTNAVQRQVLVGPKAGIFLPGNQIIDLSNSDIVAFQAEVEAALGDKNGNPCGAFRRGNRQNAAGS